MQFARANPQVNVLGLGALDSRELADKFMDTTGTGDGDITLVWEQDGESRRAFGVRSQPYWIFYDADGTEITSRPGRVDIELIQSLI